MTTTRGRGRPKLFDELELVDRIQNRDDLFRIQEALVANGEPAGQSRGLIFWLDSLRAGDPTGGYGPTSAKRYRAMLARLPEIPLPPANRRTRRAAARGAVSTRLLAAVGSAGILAFAAQPGPVALRLLALGATPIMPEQSSKAESADSGGDEPPLRLVAAGEARECVPGAGSAHRCRRVGYTPAPALEVAA